MRRLPSSIAAALIIGILSAPAASAQQTFNMSIGGFAPRSLDARGNDDVLVQESLNGGCSPACPLATFDRDLGIEMSNFNNVTIGAEWLVGLGERFEGGLGLGFYSKTVPTSYATLVNQDGTEIAQDLKLRIVPFTATVRFLPLGRHGIVPYIGAGVGVFAWRYSETGQFIDTVDRRTIFQENFVDSGSATGPVILGGIRVPAGDWSVGGEIRYQSAKGTLSTTDFIAPKIDLGGFNYLFSIGFRF
jgi:hypothetical protein